jgi:hypothetical protein
MLITQALGLEPMAETQEMVATFEYTSMKIRLIYCSLQTGKFEVAKEGLLESTGRLV